MDRQTFRGQFTSCPLLLQLPPCLWQLGPERSLKASDGFTQDTRCKQQGSVYLCLVLCASSWLAMGLFQKASRVAAARESRSPLIS